MPVKKAPTKPVTPVRTPVINTSKISSMTIGDVLGKASKFNANQAVYVLLLISFAICGYLFGKMQGMESAKSDTNAVAAAPAGQEAQAPQAPTGPVDVENGHFPVKGDENAKVTIVEFSDFECPFCGRFYTDTLPSLLKDYIDTGKVKLYYRHFPLAFHPQAKPLANVAECANEQDKFWEMHDKIFENNATVSSSTMDTFKGWAADLGLNTSKFNDCVDSSKYEKDIDADTADGTTAGVSGTPTFYINGLQLVGAQPIDAFKKIIDQELAK
ncbi:MAG: DsbA family protein [Candidatus Levybacteria bacterium]|nr:DsbA family protein [Candidatus Levybacteria bacterium]